MMGYGGFGMGFLGLLGPVMMILFWAVIVALAFYAVRAFNPRQGIVSNSQLLPIEILQQRYARGEITKEQYDGMKQDLS